MAESAAKALCGFEATHVGRGRLRRGREGFALRRPPHAQGAALSNESRCGLLKSL